MKAIHSFWSKAYFTGRWGEESKISFDIFNFALSAHLSTKLFKSIDLVTDEFGASILESLPYTNIDTDLEEISHVDKRFWTAGKVHAMRAQEEPFIHIDGDVFFMNKKSKPIIKGDWDAIVQMREIGSHFYSTYPPVFREIRKVYPEIDDINIFNFVYNNGIVGFKNMEFLKEYTYRYFDLVYNLERAGVKFPPNQDPNIAVEQSLLTTIAETSNLHVKELITVLDMQKDDLFGYAQKIGFVHLWGNSKYTEEYSHPVKERLKAENKSLYNAVNFIIKKL